MMNKSFVLLTVAAAMALVGCGDKQTSAPAESSTAQIQVVPVAGALSQALLAQGEAVISPRIKAKQESLGSIAFDESHRLGIHPGRTESSWVQIDVSGLKTLEMYPTIKKLSPACIDNPKAGTVVVGVQVDGKPLGAPLDVNRNTADTIQLTLNGAKSLRIEVGNSDGSVSCDWFVMSFGKAE
ncbi:MAG TPA: hypothetical protein DDZ67_00825 [Xanthomonadaceae bacterium]|nr:hypothetical protein [Xanthomonadaceae bacterium]